MSEEPDKFGAYPRPNAVSAGTAEQLEALADAYVAFGWTFILLFVLFGLESACMAFVEDDMLVQVALISLAMMSMAALVFFGRRGLSKAEVGLGKESGWAKQMTYLLVLCQLTGFGGLLAVAVLMSILINKIFSFGVRRNLFWYFRRRDIHEVARLIRQQQQMPQLHDMPPRSAT